MFRGTLTSPSHSVYRMLLASELQPFAIHSLLPTVFPYTNEVQLKRLNISMFLRHSLLNIKEILAKLQVDVKNEGKNCGVSSESFSKEKY